MSAVETLDQLLARKAHLAARLAAMPALGARLAALRIWQAARLASTYADLRRDGRYRPAVDFFLTDLYGPRGSAARDEDLARAWPILKRTLPGAALEILERAVTLDVLSAELDLDMADHLSAALTAASYGETYRRVGRPADRERQIALLLAIGEDLERIVRRRWIGIALRAAHAPAHAAGFGALQDFLERGFGAFREMRGAQAFLETVRKREGAFMQSLFAGRTPALEISEAGGP